MGMFDMFKGKKKDETKPAVVASAPAPATQNTADAVKPASEKATDKSKNVCEFC